jgi:hypothetical protein
MTEYILTRGYTPANIIITKINHPQNSLLPFGNFTLRPSPNPAQATTDLFSVIVHSFASARHKWNQAE